MFCTENTGTLNWALTHIWTPWGAQGSLDAKPWSLQGRGKLHRLLGSCPPALWKSRPIPISMWLGELSQLLSSYFPAPWRSWSPQGPGRFWSPQARVAAAWQPGQLSQPHGDQDGTWSPRSWEAVSCRVGTALPIRCGSLLLRLTGTSQGDTCTSEY